MRRSLIRLAAGWLVLGLPGCDWKSSQSSGGGTLVASPPQKAETAAVPGQGPAASDSAPLRDAVGPSPAGPAADYGRAFFDGAGLAGAGPAAPVPVPAPGAAGPRVSYTAPPRANTLRIVAPPPTGAAATTHADFSRIAFNESLGDSAQRRQILQRAQSSLGIPYEMGGNQDSEMDCSAWVSRVWGIPRHSTSNMLQAAYAIGKDELEPGDALLLDMHKSQTGYGHIRLFIGWADAAKSEIWICEESSQAGQSVYRKVRYSNVYQPIRRNDLPRSAAPTQVVAASYDNGPSGGAAPGDADCAPFGSIGCLYVPQSARNSGNVGLLVFFRGHYGGSGHVEGQAAVLAAARNAFTDRDIGKAGQASGMAVLVTGSSDLGVTGAQVSAAEASAGLSFGRIALAAHSGGYVGLTATLSSQNFPAERVSRVLMLDDFYSDGPLAPLQRLTARGVTCGGFYTEQSDAYVARVRSFAEVCPAEKRTDFGGDSHGRVVNACLSDYLSARSCPPGGALAESISL